jgi:hypothetical protein
MRHERIAGYLDDLARALRARGAYNTRLVAEVRDHLLDALDAAQRRGLTDDAAEGEALAMVGAADLVAQHAAAEVPRFRRAVLMTVCVCTIASIAYLTLSLLILRPPRANYWAWSMEAPLVLSVTAMTYIWVKAGDLVWRWTRPILAFASVALGTIGASAFHVERPSDFDGYGEVLGTLLLLQAVLTISYGQRRNRTPSVPA